eukprot:m.56679 g.56679  ORF g.56679 m.56679 type:complete len:68 (-) comp18780_c0_seq1:53-256(-)
MSFFPWNQISNPAACDFTVGLIRRGRTPSVPTLEQPMHAAQAFLSSAKCGQGSFHAYAQFVFAKKSP